MKRITEAQIRQVIREEIHKVLSEAVLKEPEMIGKTTFDQLKKTQQEMGDDVSTVRGPNFSTGESFLNLNDKRNVKHPQVVNKPVEIYKNSKNIYFVRFDPDDGGKADFVISNALADKLLSKPTQQSTEQEKPSLYQKLKTRFNIKE